MTQENLVADPKRSKLVAPGKTYRIQIVRDCQVQPSDGSETRIAKAGDVVEVTAACARELLTVKIKGNYLHSGESESSELEQIVRAVPYKGEKKKAVASTSPEASLDAMYENS